MRSPKNGRSAPHEKKAGGESGRRRQKAGNLFPLRLTRRKPERREYKRDDGYIPAPGNQRDRDNRRLREQRGPTIIPARYGKSFSHAGIPGRSPRAEPRRWM